MIQVSHFKMRRERADKLLSAMIEVAKDINADPAMPHYVRKLSVFGSYLSDDTVLTSLSIAYDLGARHAEDARNAALIVRCLKLRQGIQLATQSELEASEHPHRIIFETL